MIVWSKSYQKFEGCNIILGGYQILVNTDARDDILSDTFLRHSAPHAFEQVVDNNGTL